MGLKTIAFQMVYHFIMVHPACTSIYSTELTEASRKFMYSRNIFVSSLTHNHICSSQSMESTNNSTAVVVKVVQQFQSLCSGGNLQRQRALKVEEKQNSMWILSKIFQKQAAKQMAVQLATTLKIA